MRRRETGGFTPRGRVIGVALAVALVVLALFVPPPPASAEGAFNLDSANSNPVGITWTGTYFMVVDSTDDKVYAYTATGSRASSQDFNLTSGNSNPTGITRGLNYFYVVDSGDDRVYRYNHSGTYSTRFALISANSSPVGIAYGGGTPGNTAYLWVVDGSDDKVYRYSLSGSYSSSNSFALTSSNSDPSGITLSSISSPAKAYVTDSGDDIAYVYDVSSGSYDTTFAFTGGNDGPQGIAYNSGIWVVDNDDTYVYKYVPPSAPTNLTVTPGDDQLTVEWDASTDGPVSGYKIYANSVIAATVDSATTSHVVTGLNNFQDYTVRVYAYYGLWNSASVSTTVMPVASLCDSAVDLGTLAVAADSELSNSGELPAAAADLPCVDADTRGSAYFTFVIGTDDAGAVKIESAQGLSAMRPELLLRSGTGAYSGDPLFQDTRADVEDALAAGLVSAGTYTLQLRSTVAADSGQSGIGGAYSVKVTRLQPEPTGLSGFGDRMLTAWKVGLPVSDDTLNTIALPIKIEYKETKDAAWTVEQASISPENGQQSFVEEVTGLNVGGTYHARAAYVGATHYVETADIRVAGQVQLAPGPSGVQASFTLVDEDTNQHEVRVEWETPFFSVDDDTTWKYWLRLDEGIPFPNPSGVEHSQEHRFLYSKPGLLGIEVRNGFRCTETTGDCEITYNGNEYEIPAQGEWSTVWSGPAFVVIPGEVAVAGEGASAAPDQAVVALLYTVMGAAGASENEGLARTLSVLLCLVLAAFAAFWVVRRFGLNTSTVIVAALAFLLIFAGLGLEFFGVPPPLVIVIVVVPFALAGFSLMRKFAQQ